MLHIDDSPQQQIRQIVLSANCSMDWQKNMQIVAAMTLVGLLISSGFAAAGAWMIFPFAGLEIIILYLALHTWFRFGREQEVIQLTPETLMIERGIDSPHYRQVWLRKQLELCVQQGNEWHIPRIWFVEASKKFEVGRMLNREDKQALLFELEKYFQYK